jgi:hypothetical protein
MLAPLGDPRGGLPYEAKRGAYLQRLVICILSENRTLSIGIKEKKGGKFSVRAVRASSASSARENDRPDARGAIYVLTAAADWCIIAFRFTDTPRPIRAAGRRKGLCAMRNGRNLGPIAASICLLLFVLPLSGNVGAGENPCSFSGYLWGTGARASFEVYADTEETTLVFTWPEGAADFRVKATDRDKVEVLIDQSLSAGDLLTLKGRGIYYFEIYSAWGGGCWEARVKGTKEEKN